jgi:flagellar hook protein FlgE
MATYGFFQPSVLGMESHSQALSAISGNIANVNTGGYKRTDVHFETVLSRTFASSPGTPDAGGSISTQSDIGGVVPKNYARITAQGTIQTTGRELDAAIGGRGMFVLNSELDGSGATVYGRDGRFSVAAGPEITATGPGGDPLTTNEGYLVDKNGYFLQGWPVATDGSYPSGESSLTSIRVDPYSGTDPGVPTRQARLAVNLPANDLAGEVSTDTIDVFDSGGNRKSLRLDFTKAATVNTWGLDIVGGAGDTVTVAPSQTPIFATVAGQETVFTAAGDTIAVQGAGGGVPVNGFFASLSPGDVFAVTGSTGNDGSYTVGSVSADGSSITVDASTPVPVDETNAAVSSFSGLGVFAEPLVFDATGGLVGPLRYTVSVAHAGGTNSDFTLDVGDFSQFAGDFIPFDYSHDGFPPGNLESVAFDNGGTVLGRFDNGMERQLYKLALADFVNPDGLTALDGNVYALSANSGEATLAGANEGSNGDVFAGAQELSNVDLADEFTRMIMTQHAYNASATAFRTADEMTEEAADLKR